MAVPFRRALLAFVVAVGLATPIGASQIETISAYRDSAGGLRRLLQDVVAAAKDGDNDRVAEFVRGMEIPNYEEWWTKAFGQEKGESWAGPYGDELEENETAMRKLLSRIATEDGEIVTRKVNDAPTPGRGLEWGMLQALRQPTDVFFAAWKGPHTPNKSTGEFIGYFFFVDGGFRWDSIIHILPISRTTDAVPASNSSRSASDQPRSSPATIDAQLGAKIQDFAMDTAGGVAKTGAKHILLVRLDGCLFEPQICAVADSDLRATIGEAVPQAQFIDQASVADLLTRRGLLAIDIGNPDAVKLVAPDAGAEMIVTEFLRSAKRGYTLESDIFDVARGKGVDDFEVDVPKLNGKSDFLAHDPVSGAAMFIPFAGIGQMPMCIMSCQLSAYSPEERARNIRGLVTVLATVTEDGVATQVYVLHGLDDAVDRSTVEAVQNWRFRPAIGADGKVVRARISIQVQPR